MWPDVHNGLIAELRNALAPQLRPRYYVALEERTYLEAPTGLTFVSRPDVTVVGVATPAANQASLVDKPLTGVDLRGAIDAVLADSPVSPIQKASIGCNIKWKKGNEPSYFGPHG